VNRFALDCSMTMAWCFEDEATSYSESALEALAEGEAVVPPIWSLEVANVLVVGERKKRLLPAQSLRFVELLQSLPITIDTDVRPLGEILGLAREQGLSSYDASYLDLAAVRTGLPLASLDGPLLEAAARFGVARFSFKDENR
jgi:predicted nucleic acid-binding protein